MKGEKSSSSSSSGLGEDNALTSGEDSGEAPASETGEWKNLVGEVDAKAFLKDVMSLDLCVSDEREDFLVGVCGGVKIVELFGEILLRFEGLDADEWRSSLDLLEAATFWGIMKGDKRLVIKECRTKKEGRRREH